MKIGRTSKCKIVMSEVNSFSECDRLDGVSERQNAVFL